MQRHLFVSCKLNNCFNCNFCEKSFSTELKKDQHEDRMHHFGGAYFNKITNAFRCEVFQHEFQNERSVEGAFINLRLPLLNLLRFYLRRRKLIKYRLVVDGLILKTDGTQSTVPMRTTTRSFLMGDFHYLPDSIQEDKLEILNRQEGILARTGSGETLLGITAVRVELGQCDIFGGSSKFLEIADIKKIPGSEYLYNCESDNNLCFYHCVSQHLANVRNMSFDDIYQQLKFKKVAMNISKIRFFEKANDALNIGVNVFILDGKMVYPGHKSIFSDERTKINLLLIPTKNEDVLNDDITHHYVLILNLNKFLEKQHGLTGQRNRKNVVYCENCLLCYTSTEKLKTHQELCFLNKQQKVSIPKQGDITKFKNFLKQFPFPYIGFCDFEAILRPQDRKENTNCENCRLGNPIKMCNHSTHVLNNHIPVGYSLLFVDKNHKIVYQKQGHGNNCMASFFADLNQAADMLLPLMNKESKLEPWNDWWEDKFNTATSCHICHQPFSNTHFDYQKVKDHDHHSGEPLGAAHNKCNRLRRYKQKLVIYVHNLAGYDSHFLLQNFDLQDPKASQNMRAIPINSQKFRTLEFSKFLFLDSLALLDAPLDKLVDNLLVDGIPELKILRNSLIYKNNTQRKLLLRKGIFPYEWCDSYNKLISTTEFPPHEVFYSHLKESNISDDDYQHGRKTYEIFQCKNMLDYMKLYCFLDTILLAECIMRFRQEIIEEFGLCCENYISLPQLAFDCMLKFTKAEIEQMSDPDMIYMIESNIRGGVSYVNTRHVNVQNTNDSLTYLDINNLYGYVQQHKMPVSDYKWLTREEIDKIDWEWLNVDGEYGMIIECDLDFDEDLHEFTSDFPFCPETLNIFYPDLSEYSQRCLNVISGPKKAQRYHSTKLCGTFRNKTKYVTHVNNLQFYLRKGMILKKVHRVLRFRQEAFIQSFIFKISKRRRLAKTEFERTINKLIINATFGKWLQNVRKHIDVKLVTKLKFAQKWIGTPEFISYRIINENLIAIFLRKKEIKLDRNYLVGFTILELSKLTMFQTYYNVIEPFLWYTKCSIVMSDTDSFILHVKDRSTDDVVWALRRIMDFSNYPKDHPFYDTSCKQVPGKLKNETPDDEIMEIVAPKSKCYFLRLKYKPENIKKCKGVTKAKTQKLQLQQYKNCIYSKTAIKTNITNISVKNHQIRTTLLNKICMTSFDDKRHLLNCGVHSVPHGSIFAGEKCKKCV